MSEFYRKITNRLVSFNVLNVRIDIYGKYCILREIKIWLRFMRWRSVFLTWQGMDNYSMIQYDFDSSELAKGYNCLTRPLKLLKSDEILFLKKERNSFFSRHFEARIRCFQKCGIHMVPR